MMTIHEHADEISQNLGSRLHVMRESRQWTLEMLAERTGLSKAYLSRLEGGDRQPSIVALCAIAKAFGVSIAALFEQHDRTANCVIIRGGSMKSCSANGLSYLPLSSATKPFNLHPISLTVPASRAGDEVYRHVGEEWLHVFSGRLKLTIDGNIFVLEAGDSAHFDSRLPHRLDSLDDKDAQVLLVACPIPVSLNEQSEPVEMAEGVGQFVG
jgi:DNA-binding XRE family transcriptional regulator/mannose-6-phosphate isomerase-like protein (cupin superfamily)